MNKERNGIAGLNARSQHVMNKAMENLNMGNNNGRYAHNGRHEIREVEKESMTLGKRRRNGQIFFSRKVKQTV